MFEESAEYFNSVIFFLQEKFDLYFSRPRPLLAGDFADTFAGLLTTFLDKIGAGLSPLSWVEKLELASLLGVRQFLVSLFSSQTF